MLVDRRVEADDRTAFLNFLGHEVLERGHLDRLLGDLLGQMGGDDDHALGIAHHDVARPDRRVAAADGHVDLDRLVARQVGRRRGAVVIDREIHLGHLGRVAETAIGDDPGAAAHHQPGHQDRSRRGGARVLARVDDHDRARRAPLDCIPLGVLGVLEDLESI